MKKTAGILLASALLLGACGTSEKEQHEKYQKALRTFVDKDMDNFQKDTRTLKNSELVEELSKTRKSFEKDRDEFDKSTKKYK